MCRLFRHADGVSDRGEPAAPLLRHPEHFGPVRNRRHQKGLRNRTHGLRRRLKVSFDPRVRKWKIEIKFLEKGNLRGSRKIPLIPKVFIVKKSLKEILESRNLPLKM